MVAWRGKYLVYSSVAVNRLPLLLFVAPIQLLGSLVALALNQFVSVADAQLWGRDFVHVS